MNKTDKWVIFFSWFSLLIAISFTPIIKNHTYLFYVMLGVAILHASRTKGWRFTLTFFPSIFILAWIVEYFGVTRGFLFGTYYYPTGSDLGWQPDGVVPLTIPLTWALITYIGIELSTLVLGRAVPKFMVHTNAEKKWQTHASSIIYRIVVSGLAGLAITAWDVAMDPLVVMIGYYRWENVTPVAFFGVPLSNYLGWWAFVFFTSLLYYFIFDGLFASFFNQKGKEQTEKPQVSHSFSYKVMPLIIYFLMFFGNTMLALFLIQYSLLFVNLIAMLPFLVIAAINMNYRRNIS